MKAIEWQYKMIDEFVDDNPSTLDALNNMDEEGWELESVVQISNTEPKTKVDETSWLCCFFKKPLRD